VVSWEKFHKKYESGAALHACRVFTTRSLYTTWRLLCSMLLHKCSGLDDRSTVLAACLQGLHRGDLSVHHLEAAVQHAVAH
jgi:hypothetical protein